jgi:hypothetical protein
MIMKNNNIKESNNVRLTNAFWEEKFWQKSGFWRARAISVLFGIELFKQYVLEGSIEEGSIK